MAPKNSLRTRRSIINKSATNSKQIGKRSIKRSKRLRGRMNDMFSPKFKKIYNRNPKIVIYMVINDDYFELAIIMINSLRHLKIKYRLVILYFNNLPNAKLSLENQALLQKYFNVKDILDVNADWINKIKVPNIKASPAYSGWGIKTS